MPNGWTQSPANSAAFADYMAMSMTNMPSLGTHPKSRKAKKAPPPVEEELEMPTTPLDAREGFTFGCDPEGFIFKGDKPVCADGLIPGTKAQPEPIEVKGEVIGYCQVDGMAAEFNIPPVTSFREFNRHIEGTIKEIEKMLPPGHSLRFDVSAVNFDEDVFRDAPDKAKELGCSPDYNAWEGKVNSPPKDPSNPFLRCLGGHLHVGWTKDADVTDAQHVMNCCDLVKQFDWYLGAWSTKVDTDPTRRRLYGRAGACRLKDYGVEYRVLSPFWVSSRERRMAVWNRMQEAINAISNRFLPERGPMYNPMIQKAINETMIDPILARDCRFPLATLDQAACRF